MPVTCPKCYSDNLETLKFCGECGTRLSSFKEIHHEVTETYQAPIKELTTGTSFAGRYQIIEELGHGGMGRVYKVFDNDIKEKIALKLLRPEIALDAEAVERFANELELARKISQRNVCRMFDLGKAENTTFITMEYVPGEDLKKLIRKTGRLGAGRVVSIAKQICAGLEEAHHLGIVHRDLKPQNIMIDEDGDARIMDFGIARSLSGKSITGAGVMIGTPEYMAPEQIEGEKVDHRADIYSLGIVLFEMITGRVPFEGNTPLSVVLMQKTARPPDPRDLNAQTPEALCAVILKCLEKDPAARYQNIEALASELHGIAEGLDAGERTWHPGKTQNLTTGGTRLTNSVAVLPFKDLSPQKDQEYFCEGLAEELITVLAKIKDLEVAAKSSAFSAKLKNMDVREIGRLLGVAAVLEGSVRRGDNRFRITAQLINVATGYHFWSEKYERTFEDVFAIQDEITLAIVDKLKIKLLGNEKAALIKRPTASPEAYNLYLMGRYFWDKRTAEGIKRGLECFVQAIAKDPSFARAYTGIADCYGVLAYYFMPPRPTLLKAKEAAVKAFELDDTLAEAHTSLAFLKHKLERDWVGAEKEFRRAMELDPEYIWAPHWFALFLAAMGRHLEAFAAIKRALEIDPTSVQMNMAHGMILYLARSYDLAVEGLEKVVEMEPLHVLANFYLGLAYLEKGRCEEALTRVQRAADLTAGAPFFVQGLGYVHAAAGRRDLAEGVLAKLGEILTKAYVSPFFTSLIHFTLGENDRGFAGLDKAFEDGDHWLEFIKIFPGFDGIRLDPRYADLLKNLRLE